MSDLCTLCAIEEPVLKANVLIDATYRYCCSSTKKQSDVETGSTSSWLLFLCKKCYSKSIRVKYLKEIKDCLGYLIVGLLLSCCLLFAPGIFGHDVVEKNTYQNSLVDRTINDAKYQRDSIGGAILIIAGGLGAIITFSMIILVIFHVISLIRIPLMQIDINKNSHQYCIPGAFYGLANNIIEYKQTNKDTDITNNLSLPQHPLINEIPKKYFKFVCRSDFKKNNKQCYEVNKKIKYSDIAGIQCITYDPLAFLRKKMEEL